MLKVERPLRSHLFQRKVTSDGHIPLLQSDGTLRMMSFSGKHRRTKLSLASWSKAFYSIHKENISNPVTDSLAPMTVVKMDYSIQLGPFSAVLRCVVFNRLV